MVGAKSLGCATCKKRKIKCDERFPICLNCERGNRDCPGPKSRFVQFVKPGAEMHMVQTQFVEFPSSSSSELLQLELVERMRNVTQEGYKLTQFGALFTYLPARIGINAALDAAVRALLESHRLMLLHKTAYQTKDVRHYAQALTYIRNDLDELRSKTPSETVCAALILALYELFNEDVRKKAWVAHAGGVSALIKSWGPDHIATEFDLSIFASHYGSIIITSILREEDCFLLSPEWEPLRDKCLRYTTNIEPYSFRLLTALASLPSLVRDVRVLSTEGHGFTSDQRRILSLKARLFKAEIAQQCHELLVDANALLTLNKLMNAGESPTDIAAATHKDQKYAFRFHLSWAAIIIANTLLTRLGAGDSAVSNETQEAARNISNSTRYLRAFKPFGVLWTTLTVAVAYGVSPPEQQSWLVGEIQGLFDQLPIRLGAMSMKYAFESVTGGPVKLYPS
ncbi:hypothetical protein NA57DRAFT_71101 [Rhizodiscina lignyota]|uniref:Zn(2)-C6 fungal-type domain-containing protein n=1 Tax=Rhizodiscina lignyota TaxID=1504668 RepID=A0A9P4INS8_9PEZI|nr:hypothetical protein NA57DRAFT_71101 [Rhizodiscina lignyota]